MKTDPAQTARKTRQFQLLHESRNRYCIDDALHAIDERGISHESNRIVTKVGITERRATRIAVAIDQSSVCTNTRPRPRCLAVICRLIPTDAVRHQASVTRKVVEAPVEIIKNIAKFNDTPLSLDPYNHTEAYYLLTEVTICLFELILYGTAILRSISRHQEQN